MCPVVDLETEEILNFVNPLQGTDSHYGFSTGNTLPLTALPFGMNHWSPQTSEASNWFFNPRDRKLQGIRCTHQPSPWIGDYGAFVVMPQVGRKLLSATERASAYNPLTSTIKPHLFEAGLIQHGIKLEFAPTQRGGIFGFQFPKSHQSRIILQTSSGRSHVEIQPDGHLVGWTTGNNGGTLPGFALYFAATVDHKITGVTTFPSTASEERNDLESSFTGDRAGIALEFSTEAGTTVHFRIATSFISIEQAERNLAEEVTPFDLATIKSRAAQVWQEALSQIIVEGSEAQKQTFYSCLYRTLLFPRAFHEIDANGQTIHYSPYSGKVHPGVLYTDNGFWDTFRTMYPLLALLQPTRLAEILDGWVNAYKEGGWFPQWASPGYRACMVGTHIDAVFADGIARGVTTFDVQAALDGMMKHAYTPGDPKGAWGRIGIEDYRRLGYVPADKHHEALARTLDYAFDDFCIAQVAARLGKLEDAQKLSSQTKNYANCFDASVGFMRGKNEDGSWLEPWNEFQWGSPYVEGGPWQSSWAVQHDIPGLIDLMGGEEAFVEKLDKMLSTKPYFEIGVYGVEIHEMTEMAVANFGQYAHSNQPVHHVLYLYNAAGRPWRTQAEVRRVLETLYSPSHQPGDEDNGEMSAWYVLSSLGIYPLTPGRGTWALGSPLFSKATIRLEGGRDLVITAPGNSKESVYVERVALNGLVHESVELAHADLASGGTLEFTMSKSPKQMITPRQYRPSMS